MKKLLILIPFITFIAACNNGNKLTEEQPKAEALVKAYLNTTLGKDAAYQPLLFDTLREVSRSYAIDHPEGRKLDALAKTYSDSALSYRKKADEQILNNSKPDTSISRKFHIMEAAFLKKSDSVSALIVENSKGYEGKSQQYNILHTYSAKDNLGHAAKHVTIFWLDKALTKVEHQQEAQ